MIQGVVEIVLTRKAVPLRFVELRLECGHLKHFVRNGTPPRIPHLVECYLCEEEPRGAE